MYLFIRQVISYLGIYQIPILLYLHDARDLEALDTKIHFEFLQKSETHLKSNSDAQQTYSKTGK